MSAATLRNMPMILEDCMMNMKISKAKVNTGDQLAHRSQLPYLVVVAPGKEHPEVVV